MKTRTIPAHAVPAGATVLLAGSQYVVEANIFDRHGRAPHQPISILICNAHPERADESGAYGEGQHFGMLPSEPVTMLPSA